MGPNKFSQRAGPSSPPATPTTASFAFNGLSGKKSRRQGAIFQDFPTITPELHDNGATIIPNGGTTFSYNRFEPLDLSPRSSSPASSEHSDSSSEDSNPARSRSSSPVVEPISESPPKPVRIRIVKEGNFTVEEFRESDYEGFDSDSESVLRPHQYEDAESEKARSTRASSPHLDLDDGVVNGIRDLDCGTEEQERERKELEREAWVERQRLEKRRKRRSSGSVKKRNLLESIGSDTDDEDLKPVMFEGANEAGSSARRLRRKVAGERTSLIFDDPPVGRIVEESEPESIVAGQVVESDSEEEPWGRLPFHGESMDVDSSSEEEESDDE
jgi:hypothetical protein